MTLLILLICLRFKNGNFDDLRDSLSRVPFEIAASADINEFWDNWKALFLSAVKDHIPIKTVRDTNSLPWIDSEVRHWICKKYTALKKFHLNKTPERKRKLRPLTKFLPCNSSVASLEQGCKTNLCQPCYSSSFGTVSKAVSTL